MPTYTYELSIQSNQMRDAYLIYSDGINRHLQDAVLGRLSFRAIGSNFFPLVVDVLRPFGLMDQD